MEYEVDGTKFRFDAPSDFLFSVNDLNRITKLVDKCLETVSNSDSVRLIVLETWMISDYFVRLILGNALNIEKYNCEDYDALYELLPSNFSTCLSMLEKLLKKQRSLPVNPQKQSGVTFGFYKHLKDKYPQMDLDKDIQEYEGNMDFEQLNNIRLVYGQSNIFQNNSWVRSCNNLNKKWFECVRELNKLRNLSAHTYDAIKICNKLGFTGDNAIEETRQYCLDIIDNMFYLKNVVE